MIKSTIVHQTAAHLQRELNRLESEKEKVRKALAAVQAIFGSGEGIRALRHPRRNGSSPSNPRPPLRKTRKRAHKGPEKICPLCHEKFRQYKRTQIFCARTRRCKSNSRAALLWRRAQREKQQHKGTTLISGDPLRPGQNA